MGTVDVAPEFEELCAILDVERLQIIKLYFEGCESPDAFKVKEVVNRHLDRKISENAKSPSLILGGV